MEKQENFINYDFINDFNPGNLTIKTSLNSQYYN